MLVRRVMSSVVAGIAVVGLVVACSSGEEVDQGGPTNGSESTGGSVDDVRVEQGQDTVDVTIPKEFFENQTDEEILQEADDVGYQGVVINPDGSVTYTMPTTVYNEILQGMTTNIDQLIAELRAESPDVFRDIVYDTDVSRFIIEVNRDAFELSPDASFVGFGLGIGALFYQIFSGVPENQREVVIDFVDVDTGDVFDSQTWPGE